MPGMMTGTGKDSKSQPEVRGFTNDAQVRINTVTRIGYRICWCKKKPPRNQQKNCNPVSSNTCNELNEIDTINFTEGAKFYWEGSVFK